MMRFLRYAGAAGLTGMALSASGLAPPRQMPLRRRCTYHRLAPPAGFVNDVPTPANHVTITGNTVKDNVGSGIDINSTSYSVASKNVAIGNGVGINMSDDLGVAASHNRIIGNVSDDNPGGCGIALAAHTGMGVFDNVISGNVADDNGLGSPSAPDASAGSGIILADPAPAGGVYDNQVLGNQFSGNGHAGVLPTLPAPTSAATSSPGT